MTVQPRPGKANRLNGEGSSVCLMGKVHVGSGPQPGLILHFRGHLAKSGDI